MKNRYLSLDVFRGATVALMIFVNNPGSFSHIYWPIDHAEWNGCTMADLVFPFFLFAVGNAMAFVLPDMKSAGVKPYFLKISKRSLLIFSIGLFLSWFPFVKWNENQELIGKAWENVRIMGVLQRIAVCYFFASVMLFFFNNKQIIYLSIGLLFFYWLICYWAGSSSDPYSLSGYFGTKVDMFLFGDKHMYHGEDVAFDPEGISSSIAAIVQVLFGYLLGSFIIREGKTQGMLNQIFSYGFLLVVAGLCWNVFFPVNKKIWTSSYTVLTTGVALLTIAYLILQIELKNLKGKWTTFFDVFGKNPLFIFVLSGMIPRLAGLIKIQSIDQEGAIKYINPLSWVYENIFKSISSDPRLGSMIYTIFYLGLLWAIGYFLYRKKIFIKV